MRYEGENRRSVPEGGWHLDKKVPLSLIFAMIVQVIVVTMFFADIKRDVELLKADTAVLHQRDSQLVNDSDKQSLIIQGQYQRLEAKLDRLIEKSK